MKSRRLSENALLPKLFVMLKKIILGISTICLWLFFQAFLDFEQNCLFSDSLLEGRVITFSGKGDLEITRKSGSLLHSRPGVHVDQRMPLIVQGRSASLPMTAERCKESLFVSQAAAVRLYISLLFHVSLWSVEMKRTRQTLYKSVMISLALR